MAEEQNFSQIEKETLPILFSDDNVQEYLYGARFRIDDNHKQLVSIFQQLLSNSSPRIQLFL